jgi:hypothetical protein
MLGAMARIAPPKPIEAMARIAPRFLVPQPNGKQTKMLTSRFFCFRFKIRNGPLLVGFYFFGLDSSFFSKYQIDSKRGLGSIGGSTGLKPVTRTHNFTFSVAAVSAESLL